MSNYSSIFYKADQRISDVVENNKSLSTLPKSFGDLVYLQDIFLGPGDEKEIFNSTVSSIILPIAGSLIFRTDLEEKYLHSEEVLLITPDNKNYTLKNPYESETVNFLSIGLNTNQSPLQSTRSHTTGISEFNKLSTLNLNTISSNSYASLGVFKTRAKGSYTLKDIKNGAFAFVINGAFELEERLMEHRDGLALWETQKIEFEALSEFAILLLIEIYL